MCILGVKFRQWVPVGASDRSKGARYKLQIYYEIHLNELTFSAELKTFEISSNNLK